MARNPTEFIGPVTRSRTASQHSHNDRDPPDLDSAISREQMDKIDRLVQDYIYSHRENSTLPLPGQNFYDANPHLEPEFPAVAEDETA